MSFKDFLDKHGVVGIAPEFVTAMDSAGTPSLLTCFGPVPLPAVGKLTSTVPPAIGGLTGAAGPSLAGAIALMLLIETDITSLIIQQLIPASIAIKAVPPVPTPPVPITPSALAAVPIPDPNARKFANAALDWALSLVPAFGSIYGMLGPIQLIPL